MEQNNCHYGSFVVRYLPLSYMVTMSELLCSCGTPKQIKSLKEFLDVQAKIEIKPIKTRKYNFIEDIDKFKEKLLQKFNEARIDLGMRLQPAQQEE